MTYARARLWLGITGVGTVVVLAWLVWRWGWATAWLSSETTWRWSDPVALIGVLALWMLVLAPFDLLGGWLVPSRFGRAVPTLGGFLTRWRNGLAVQGGLYWVTGMGLLAVGRIWGLPGAVALITVAMVAYLSAQRPLLRWLVPGLRPLDQRTTLRLGTRLSAWALPMLPVDVVDHDDLGFTGGVVGLPGAERVLVPDAWLDRLDDEALAVLVARRVETVVSGSRTRGVLVGMSWTLLGFVVAASAPMAGVTSMAALVNTMCLFTLWSFLGLVTLPTVSRQASLGVDARVRARGVAQDVLDRAIATVDALGDDEPSRPALVETIFHPVPGRASRHGVATDEHRDAWHAARMTIYLSWAGLGFLSRAVHCNVGRPELWTMLPTD